MASALTSVSTLCKKASIRVNVPFLIGALLIIAGIHSLAFPSLKSIIISLSSLAALFGSQAVSHKTLQRALLIVLGITCGLGCLEAVLGYKPASWLGNPNLLGYAAAILLSVSIVARCWICLPLAVVALISSQCTGAMLTVTLGYALYTWRQKQHIYALIALSVACVLLITNGSNSYVVRLTEWIDSIQALATRGSVFSGIQVASKYNQIHSHNAIIEAIRGAGFIPGSAMVAAGSAITAEIAMSRKFEACIGTSFLVVSSMVDYIYWYPLVSVIVIAWIISIEGNHA